MFCTVSGFVLVQKNIKKNQKYNLTFSCLYGIVESGEMES
jgi:hypothetical protein